MARRDIIVIGASLGGLDALPRLVASFPGDLDAAVFIVMHMAPDAPNYLAARLDGIGPLRAAAAIDGESIRANRIYVAVPDRHLMVDGDQIRLSNGPRESHARPSIDVLFRSAAFCCGPRVIGVVLTGSLEDGTAGLWAIKDRGGIAITQSPEEAAYPGMPLSAARHVQIDRTLRLAEMSRALHELAHEDISARNDSMSDRKLEIEQRVALGENALQVGVRGLGTPSFYTCPECHGSMVEIKEGSIRRFKCHTGHGYTAESLSERGLTQVEETLWAALAQLEEREVLLRELEQTSPRQTDDLTAQRIASAADDARRLAVRLRDLVRDPAFSRSSSTED